MVSCPGPSKSLEPAGSIHIHKEAINETINVHVVRKHRCLLHKLVFFLLLHVGLIKSALIKIGIYVAPAVGSCIAGRNVLRSAWELQIQRENARSGFSFARAVDGTG